MLGQTHIQEVNLFENVVDKKYKKYDAFFWKFSHGGLFLALVIPKSLTDSDGNFALSGICNNIINPFIYDRNYCAKGNFGVVFQLFYIK